jgi:hypothetical protein
MVIRIGMAARRAGLSIAEFQSHWHDEHGPLVARFKGVKRVWQNHALLREGTPILPWPGFDACPELEFGDLDAAKLAFSPEHYPPALRADSAKLVDMTKSAILFADRIHAAGTIDLRHVRLLMFMRRAPGRTQTDLNDALRVLPRASEARAREIYLPVDAPEAAQNGFDAVDSQWFETARQAERYVISAEAGEHRNAIAHLVRGVERLIAHVRVIL